ncbi:MAG TPA: sigma-70 family RNA polymerase sigma factor [Candidatus Aminicenantes bacterium]|nr:sigma-70 family RNA polymerase sigma factor [Candidatus Aminicenantes bacterium]
MASEPVIPFHDNASRESRDLLNHHLDFIQSRCKLAIQCQAAGSRTLPGIDLENESLELFNLVIDRIRKNDYAVIRRFDRRARFTTYLTTLIARQAVERIRRRKGRTRTRERAESLGRLGIRLFEKIVSQGLGVPDALREMMHESLPGMTEQRLTQMANHILGQRSMPPTVIISMGEMPDCPEPSGVTPESAAFEKERQARITAAVSLLRSRLSGTEWLLLRLRFPPDPRSPARKASEIASLMGISRKAVYRRLDRLLPHCRTILRKAGIDFCDLFSQPQGNSFDGVRPNQGSIES